MMKTMFPPSGRLKIYGVPAAILLGLVSFSLAVAREGSKAPNFQVDGERIQRADEEPGNWITHGRTYDESRFSPLDQINADNIGELGLAWAFETGVGRGHQATPMVVDGVMIFTLPWSVVHAVDAKTGEPLWSYDPVVPRESGRNACCDVINRGGALWKGKFYFATLDGRLIALDPATGEPAWEVMTVDPEQPYTITGAPRIVKDKVIIGNGGAEYGVRGYFSAYDTETGEMVWRFYTVPGDPEEPFEHPELEAAAETWTGRWWEMGGGGTAWDSMAYDPDLDLLYVGTGNGSPWSRKIRSPEGGDNLYLSSILALNPDTGRLVWHYQTTPADNWDYTATQHMILADLEIGGELRKVILQAPKNGFFYVLDRETGELLSADNYVTTTWASHVDMETGRPVETGGDYGGDGRLILPSPSGGHIWHPMSFNPETGLVYIPALESAMIYVLKEDFEFQPGQWNTGIDFGAAVAQLLSGEVEIPQEHGLLIAWDPVERKPAWTVRHPGIINSGLLSTAGNLVFQGTSDGRFVAYRADTGEKVWEIRTDISIIAPPVTYLVDGEQYIAVLAGFGGSAITGFDAFVASAVTHVNHGRVLAFKLGGEAEAPAVVAKRVLIPPAPPMREYDEEEIMRGHQLYHAYCFQCHGVAAVSSGVTSDLRFLSSSIRLAFDTIVHDGALLDKGMPGFDTVLDHEAIEAIQSYVTVRAMQDREAMLAAMRAQEEEQP
jgi:quinohemoprotein ethanol dehydrogenase